MNETIPRLSSIAISIFCYNLHLLFIIIRLMTLEFSKFSLFYQLDGQSLQGLLSSLDEVLWPMPNYFIQIFVQSQLYSR